MAKTKQQIASSETRLARLTDRPEYQNELAKLARVKSELEASILRLENLTRTRLGDEAQRLLQRNIGLWQDMSDQQFDRLALDVCEEGKIGDRLAGRIRLYARDLAAVPDEYDQNALEKIREGSRHIELLKRAVVLQSAACSTQRNVALAGVGESSRSEREKIARNVAASVLDLVNAVREENAFFESLRSQDEALISTQSPGPFPIALDSESEVCRWLCAALRLSDLEARNLMLQPSAMRERERGTV